MRDFGLQIFFKRCHVMRGHKILSSWPSRYLTQGGFACPAIVALAATCAGYCATCSAVCGSGVSFLKVSLEEVLTALRDDRHLLNDPDGLFQADKANGNGAVSERDSVAQEILYPNEFSAERFVEVIESGAVWDKTGGETVV